MTDITETFSPFECNGDTPPESSQQTLTKINEEVSDVDGSPPYYKEEPNPEDLSPEVNQEEIEKLQDNMHLKLSMEEKILEEKPEENLFIVHKAITDLNLQEMNVDEKPFREGNQWEKIPLTGSIQEIDRQKERIIEQTLEEREDEDKTKVSQEAEIEWLGFQKSHQINILSSKYDEEQEVWDEEINNENDDNNDEDEDEVREIEFKKKSEASSQLKEIDASEDSPLSSPSSQPVTPDEQPTLVKKSDISRNSYSRYNTISYRKIRKGNTKQRIDEFESMMNL
ncbi:ermin [Sorex fumeus]|uniref:ermin n=1 Tax=Sorex fumeus TaxID=62283 RepID=UPI0024AE260B|nr:ermin [Sorex fumeus]